MIAARDWLCPSCQQRYPARSRFSSDRLCAFCCAVSDNPAREVAPPREVRRTSVARSEANTTTHQVPDMVQRPRRRNHARPRASLLDRYRTAVAQSYDLECSSLKTGTEIAPYDRSYQATLQRVIDSVEGSVRDKKPLRQIRVSILADMWEAKECPSHLPSVTVARPESLDSPAE